MLNMFAVLHMFAMVMLAVQHGGCLFLAMLRVVVMLMTEGGVGGPEAEGYVHYSQEGFKEGFAARFSAGSPSSRQSLLRAGAQAKGEHTEGGADGVRQG